MSLDHLAGLGYRGVNITVPNKQRALTWCSHTDPFSERVTAVNTISLEERSGINTDGPGFLDTLREREIGRGRALILGAGGSARSVALALSEEGFELAIFNRTRSRAQELVSSLRIDARILDHASAAGFDLVVNTTSAGLNGEELRVEWEDASGTAYDLTYGSHPTSFLIEASHAGLDTIDGLPLLVAQGARSFEWWLGKDAPRETMWKAVQCAF
jgi:shikimate dehydrogenase